jgi:hypothetical protein
MSMAHGMALAMCHTVPISEKYKQYHVLEHTVSMLFQNKNPRPIQIGHILFRVNYQDHSSSGATNCFMNGRFTLHP